MTNRREFNRPDEHSDRTPSSDQAGPSRPARARALLFFGSTWENAPVSSNESSTSEEQRLQQREQRERLRLEQQPLEYRQERLMRAQDKRKKQLNKREEKIKILENLMHEMECRDQLPHEKNLQELDDQLYKQDLAMLEHIGQAHMLEKRLELLEYLQQRFIGNMSYLSHYRLVERTRYIEQFERQHWYIGEQQNKLKEMESWLKEQIKPKLGKGEQKHLHQMMDKIRIDLKPQNMKNQLKSLKDQNMKKKDKQQQQLNQNRSILDQIKSLKDQKEERKGMQQQQLNEHRSILENLNQKVNIIELYHRLDIQIDERRMAHDIILRRIEKEEINLDKMDRNLKQREEWLEERKLRFLHQPESGPYNRLKKLEQLEEDNKNKWNDHVSWLSNQRSNIRTRREALRLRRQEALRLQRQQDQPQHTKELLDAAKDLKINLPAQHTEEWTKFLHHVYEDPGDIRLDPNQAKPLNDGEILMLTDILYKKGINGNTSNDPQEAEKCKNLTDLIVKKYQEFHNQGNTLAQGSGSRTEDSASKKTTSRRTADGSDHPQMSHYPAQS